MVKSWQKPVRKIGLSIIVSALIIFSLLLHGARVEAVTYVIGQTLTPSGQTSASPMGGCRFAPSNSSCLAASADFIVVGSPTEDSLGADSGAAFVYSRSGSTWSQQQKLIASDGAAGDRFGTSAAVYGTTIVIGAAGDDITTFTDAGSVYSFDLIDGIWEQTQKLTAITPAAYAKYGFSADMNAERLAIGEPGRNGATSASNAGRGAVYTLQRNGINWDTPLYFPYTSPISGTVNAGLGFSLSLNGSSIAAGAPYDYSTAVATAQTNSGSVSLLQVGASQITSQQRFIRSSPRQEFYFGRSIDYKSDSIIVGNDQSNAHAVTTFFYDRTASNWVRQELTITQSEARVGYSVALNDAGTIGLVGTAPAAAQTRFHIIERNQATNTWSLTGSVQGPTSSEYFSRDLTFSGDSPVILDSNTNGSIITYNQGDSAPPTLSYALDPSKTFTNQPYDVTITASEPITGLTLSDLVPQRSNVSNFTAINQTQYSVRVTPTSEGDTRFIIPAGSFQDLNANANAQSISPTVTYDTTRPTVDIVTNKAATNSTPINFTVNVNDNGGPIIGFSQSDISVTGGSITTYSESSSANRLTANISVMPTGQGEVTVNLPQDVAEDQAGNKNSAASAVTVTYDTSVPTPIFSTPQNPTNQASIPVELDFSETLTTDATASDIDITGGTISDFTVQEAKRTYSFNVSGSAQTGTIELMYASGQKTDLSGNANDAAQPLSIYYDIDGPSAAITAQAALTNANLIPFAVNFDEPVTGLAASDFSVLNGSVSTVTSQSAQSYTVYVTPQAEGAVQVSLPAGAVIDSLSNTSKASNVATASYDSIKPVVSINTDQKSPTNTSPVEFTITLGETPVQDLGQTAISVSNGQLSSFSKQSSTDYKVIVTPNADGQVTLAVADDAITDSAGNGNVAVSRYIEYDTTAPSGTVRISTTANTSPALSGTLSESDASVQVTVNGQTVSAVTTGSTWSLGTGLLDELADGTYDVTLQITDKAGNIGTDSTVNELTIHTQAPTATLEVESRSPTNQSPIEVSVAFSSDVTGLEASDFTVSGGTVQGIDTINHSQYVVRIAPTASEGIVRLNQSAVTDDYGNRSSVSNQVSFKYDASRPTVVVTSGSKMGANGLTVAAEFSEDTVGSLDPSQIDVSPGVSVSNLIKQSSKRWTFTVTTSQSGIVTISIPQGVMTDAALNGNEASNMLSVEADFDPPGVPTVASLTTTSTTPTIEGTYDTADTTQLRVTIGGKTFSASVDVPAEDGLMLEDGKWKIDISHTNVSLGYGVYDIVVEARDSVHNLSYDTTSNEIVINSPDQLDGTVDRLVTADTSPELTGTVTNTNALVSVSVNGRTYQASNNRDGSWTLNDNVIQPLSNGTYDVVVTMSAANAVGTDSTGDELIIDTSAPRGTFTRIVTYSSSPRLFGTVDTDTTQVTIALAGKEYTPEVQDGGTWELAEGTIQPGLSTGKYLVTMYLDNTTTNTESQQVVRSAIIVTGPAASVPGVTGDTAGGSVQKLGQQSASYAAGSTRLPNRDNYSQATVLTPVQSDSTKPPSDAKRPDESANRQLISGDFVRSVFAGSALIALAGSTALFYAVFRKRRSNDS